MAIVCIKGTEMVSEVKKTWKLANNVEATYTLTYEGAMN